jgi:hypothetical protein
MAIVGASSVVLLEGEFIPGRSLADRDTVMHHTGDWSGTCTQCIRYMVWNYIWSSVLVLSMLK